MIYKNRIEVVILTLFLKEKRWGRDLPRGGYFTWANKGGTMRDSSPLENLTFEV